MFVTPKDATVPASPATVTTSNPPTTGPHTAAAQLRFDDLGTPLIETVFAVLDLETTGLDPSADRITEVGVVKVAGGEVLGELRTFVHPGRPIPARITAVTGITDGMVADAPRMQAVLDHLLDFLDGAVFVAHNASFDLAFLRAAATRHHRPRPEPVVIDTARLSRRLLGDEVRDHRLATVARHLKARTTPTHRALADARAGVDVLHGLLERAGGLGATTLEDLVELGRSRSQRAYRRRDLVADAPRSCGVYRFLDGDARTLYVGKATDLRARLRTYFGQDPRRRIADMVRETVRVTWEVTPTLLAAEVTELRAIQHEQPRYNRRSRRQATARFVAVTREPFPRLVVTRAPGSGHLTAIGPLQDAKTAQHLRTAIEESYPIRSCTTRLRRAQDHPSCVLKDLGRCAAPCDGSQDAAGYAQDLEEVLELCTDPSPLLQRLQERMVLQAAAGRYERARELRDRTHLLARALTALRVHTWLTGAASMELQRTGPGGTEVVWLRHGVLVATALLPDGAAHDADVQAARVRLPGGERDPSFAELELIRNWVADPGVTLRATSTPLCSPVSGGAALAAALQTAHRTDRAVRRDRQVLSGSKVRRRDLNAS